MIVHLHTCRHMWIWIICTWIRRCSRNRSDSRNRSERRNRSCDSRATLLRQLCVPCHWGVFLAPWSVFPAIIHILAPILAITSVMSWSINSCESIRIHLETLRPTICPGSWSIKVVGLFVSSLAWISNNVQLENGRHTPIRKLFCVYVIIECSHTTARCSWSALRTEPIVIVATVTARFWLCYTQLDMRAKSFALGARNSAYFGTPVWFWVGLKQTLRRVRDWNCSHFFLAEFASICVTADGKTEVGGQSLSPWKAN